VFLSGTLLNAATVLAGTTIGLLIGGRMAERIHGALTAAVGLFTLALGMAMATRIFADPAVKPGDDLAVLAALLAGLVIGELLRLSDALDALGAWFQRRLSRDERPSRIAEGFVTASIVFCVGPLTILGSIDNGLTGDITLLAVKSLLDFVTSIAFAAALGAGVYLSIGTILVVQGGIAAAAFVLRDVMDPITVLAVTAVGGLILLAVGLLLLDLKRLRVANFLPALLLAPIFVRLAELVRTALG
jgi:uncharacterized membrane protein YqgA involved in biofilm formation